MSQLQGEQQQLKLQVDQYNQQIAKQEAELNQSYRLKEYQTQIDAMNRAYTQANAVQASKPSQQISAAQISKLAQQLSNAQTYKPARQAGVVQTPKPSAAASPSYNTPAYSLPTYAIPKATSSSGGGASAPKMATMTSPAESTKTMQPVKIFKV